MSKNDISMSVIRRLPRYYRFLSELDEQKVERISSNRLAQIMNVTASQVRQDLNCFGGFGQQGYGYSVSQLRLEIRRILGLNHRYQAVLLGAGNFGTAVAGYIDFPKLGFERLDYPEADPEEVKNYLALHQEDGEIKFERIPIRYWGNMKEQYEAHNPDYAGVYKP